MRHAFILALACLLLCTVVVPNSLPELTGALLVSCAALALALVDPLAAIPRLLKFHAASVAVSLVYLLVGQVQNAPAAAATQVAVIYLVSPALWMLIATALFQRIDARAFARGLHLLCVLALASVGLYFFLFLTGGAAAVRFFIANANVNLEDGYAGATMYVYGSLIFLSAGYFAVPGIVGNVALRLLLLLALPVAALTSGRGALIIAPAIGLSIGLLIGLSSGRLPGARARSRAAGLVDRLLASPPFLAALAGFAVLAIAAHYRIDLSVILGGFLQEVDTGGGAERATQARALLDGALDNHGLGAGHGIGVNYIRSEAFPWRYEMVGLATLYRVGVLGFLVYAAPFVAYLLDFARLHRARRLDALDIFMFAGLAVSLLAANTNPYIEAFAFQWMFIFPLVRMEIRMKSESRNRSGFAFPSRSPYPSPSAPPRFANR